MQQELIFGTPKSASEKSGKIEWLKIQERMLR